jgi:hypothetical protein
MKTRTLLLLALACGVAIMLAGAVFLVQLSGQDEVEPPVALGDVATAGDMNVVVDGADESAGFLDVTVRIGGVADDDGAGGFRLIASGRAVEPVTGDDPDGADGLCGPTTVAEQTCVVRFDVSGADGTSRVLFYERGEDGVRWVLG